MVVNRFGPALAAARGIHGLSQSRLAVEAGFDHSYISRLEAGKRDPSRETVMALAQVLELEGAEVDKLLLAADFRPLDDSSLFTDEPVIMKALRLLRNPHVPEPMRANFREVLELLVQQWSGAVGESSPSAAD